jgi:hypothetical protein
MSKSQKLAWSVVFVMFLIAGVVISFASSPGKLKPETPSSPITTTTPTSRARQYVHRARIHPTLTWNLDRLGNRLEVPGKERVSMVGSLRIGESRTNRAATVLYEFPNRLRITLADGTGDRTITFNQTETRADSPPSVFEQDLLETLVYDSAEHFFSAETESHATRFLGSRYRMDDGTAANYAGPYYDIYQLAAEIKLTGNVRLRPKFYYFNSDTLLLDRVRYESERDGVETRVEVMLGDWRSVTGQRVPHRIERFENGRTAFVFTITSLVFASRAEDWNHLCASRRPDEGTVWHDNASLPQVVL